MPKVLPFDDHLGKQIVGINKFIIVLNHSTNKPSINKAP